MNPLRLNVPYNITTERLTLRPPQHGDGAMVNAAVKESLNELMPWMPFAKNGGQPVEETEDFMRICVANFATGKEFPYLMFSNDSGAFLGLVTMLRINWAVPCVEIGYWLRTSASGKGYVTEAVNKLTEVAFDVLQAERIEICMLDGNVKSEAVAKRAGYTFESRMKHKTRDANGKLCDLLVYTKLRDSTPQNGAEA